MEDFNDILAFPICFGLISISKEFVPIFMGEEFKKTAILVNLLSITYLSQCPTFPSLVQVYDFTSDSLLLAEPYLHRVIGQNCGFCQCWFGESIQELMVMVMEMGRRYWRMLGSLVMC